MTAYPSAPAALLRPPAHATPVPFYGGDPVPFSGEERLTLSQMLCFQLPPSAWAV